MMSLLWQPSFAVFILFCLNTGHATGSCNIDEVREMIESAVQKTKVETVKLMIDAVNNLPEDKYEGLGLTANKPAESCRQLHKVNSSLPSGEYWVSPSNPVKVYCEMSIDSCGDTTGGWMKIADLDMTRPGDACPAEFTTLTEGGRRLCVLNLDVTNCASVKYSTYEISYNKTCGKVIGYQHGWPIAFNKAAKEAVDPISNPYVYGVVIAYSSSPRKHIWTFAAAPDDVLGNSHYKCPCINTGNPGNSVPDYVGKDYFCDTALHGVYYHNTGPRHLITYNPLWDGQEQCSSGGTYTCCDFPGGDVKPPWFHKDLPESTSSDVEVRQCRPSWDGTTPVQKIELYVQ